MLDCVRDQLVPVAVEGNLEAQSEVQVLTQLTGWYVRIPRLHHEHELLAGVELETELLHLDQRYGLHVSDHALHRRRRPSSSAAGGEESGRNKGAPHYYWIAASIADRSSASSGMTSNLAATLPSPSMTKTQGSLGRPHSSTHGIVLSSV